MIKKDSDLCGVCGFEFGIEFVCSKCGHERSELSSKHCMNGYSEVSAETILSLLKKKSSGLNVNVDTKNPIIELLKLKGVIDQKDVDELSKNIKKNLK